MILVTGAAGRTGRAVVRALAERGAAVRALVHRPEQNDLMVSIGAAQVIVGDLGDRSTIERAVNGVSALYHICPNVNPLEIEFAELLIQASVKAEVRHFGYHSVLHPQTERMVHHWRKLRVEEALFESGLSFTILQPCAYMQNLSAYIESIKTCGVIQLPYSVSARLSFVDLQDVADVVATVLCGPQHKGAVYELAGPEAVDHVRIAEIFHEVLGKPVQAQRIGLETWASSARRNGLGEEQIGVLCAMFEYYDAFGLVGNPNVLTHLLGRQPNTLEDFVRHLMAPA